MNAILIANSKGGSGKTTFATTLAAALAATGDRVALADADRQRSSLTWLGRRPRVEAPITALDWSRRADIGRFPACVSRASLDWVVIDAPGALKGPKAEALVAQATYVVAPVTPSFFDAHAAQGFLARIENLARIRRGGAAFLVAANRVPPRGRLARDLADFFLRIELEPAAEIAERSAYPELAAQGLSVFDRRGRSVAPIQAQWTPLLNRLGAAHASSRPEAVRRAV